MALKRSSSKRGYKTIFFLCNYLSVYSYKLHFFDALNRFTEGLALGRLLPRLAPRLLFSGLDVLIYYWDDRDGSGAQRVRVATDALVGCETTIPRTIRKRSNAPPRPRGPELCGWWFGPNVGGDQARREGRGGSVGSSGRFATVLRPSAPSVRATTAFVGPENRR